jgi:hypothetical protein
MNDGFFTEPFPQIHGNSAQIIHCGYAAPHTLMRIEDGGSNDTKILYCDYFNIIKGTKCGVWINVWGTKKFVNMQATKRYAHSNIQDATNSFIERRKTQVRILTAQKNRAEWFLYVAKEISI